MLAPNPIPVVVVTAIGEAFPTLAREILASMRWCGLDGCYYFSVAGMLVACELDGYVHS